MSWSTVKALLIALGLCVPASCAADAPSVTVELRESVAVEGDTLRLAQLAQIAPSDRAEALGAIAVGPAPLPGRSRRVSLGYLKMRLRRSGVECSGIEFTGADAVEVRRAPLPGVTRRQAQGEIVAADPPGARQSDQTQPPAPVAVERGTRVRLTVVCGAVSIGAEATLLEAAVVGGPAKMRVEQTRETVVAQIVQPCEAVIRRE
ncbi:MAG: hypothetical protein ACOCX2_02420 [Armatimonadota bacterium]